MASMSATLEPAVGTLVDTIEIPVERGKIRELAIATQDPDPVYATLDAALAAGLEEVPAPPTYSVVAGHYRDQRAAVDTLGLALERILVGEVSWEYLVPVFAGDLLRGDRYVVDVSERAGRRGGLMKFVTMETELRNRRDQIAVRWRETLIERSVP